MEVNVKTKYDIGDILYRIIDNNIRKFKIVSWNVICKHSKDDKTFKYKTTTEVIYGLEVVHSNGVVFVWYDSLTENELETHFFKSKEELVDNLLNYSKL